MLSNKTLSKWVLILEIYLSNFIKATLRFNIILVLNLEN